MSLSGPTMGTEIQSQLAADGAVGPNLFKFSQAIGKGVVNAIVGTGFTVAGLVGPGSGTGITGFNIGAATSAGLAAMLSQGPKAATFMLAIMTGVNNHISSSATLTSPSHNGSVVAGSYDVTQAALEASIINELTLDGAVGPNRNNISHAIAVGVRVGLNSASGTLGGGGIFPGSGSGTVS